MKRWKVQDVMSSNVISVEEDAPFKEIVEKLASHKVSALPVVDAENRVLGIVSETDLIHKIELLEPQPHVQLLERKRRRTARAKASGQVARDLMTRPAVCISAGASLSAVARMMDDENVKRMPVVGEQHRLIGMVTRRDLLSLYLRDDHEIRDDVVNNVLLRSMWIDPATVDVAVEHGVVTLSGTIDRRSTGDIIVQLCASVAGVVNVVSQLKANYDDTDDLRHHGFMEATVKETTP